MDQKNEKIITCGPFTFALDSNPENFKLERNGKIFFLSTSLSITNVDKQIRNSIHLYQEIRRVGYSYRMFLQEVNGLCRICFAIPMDKKTEEQREMIQWIVSRNPGSIYYEWYADCYDKLFDESKICGYRIAHNRHQENRLRISGELL